MLVYNWCRFSGLPKVILNKQRTVSSVPHVKQAKTYVDLVEVAFPMLCQLGPHLACDQVLLVKVNRLARSFMEKVWLSSLSSVIVMFVGVMSSCIYAGVLLHCFQGGTNCFWPPCIADAGIIFLCCFFRSFFFFSSPNLSSWRFNVYQTSTHGGPSANLDCRSEMYCMRLTGNAGRKKSPSPHHCTTLSGHIFATKARVDSPKRIVKEQCLPHMSSQYGEILLTSGWDLLESLGHCCKFQQVSHLGSVTAQHSSSGHQPNIATLNRGRHLYSAGQPSHWALAHISRLVAVFLSPNQFNALTLYLTCEVKTGCPEVRGYLALDLLLSCLAPQPNYTDCGLHPSEPQCPCTLWTELCLDMQDGTVSRAFTVIAFCQSDEIKHYINQDCLHSLLLPSWQHLDYCNVVYAHCNIVNGCSKFRTALHSSSWVFSLGHHLSIMVVLAANRNLSSLQTMFLHTHEFYVEDQ